MTGISKETQVELDQARESLTPKPFVVVKDATIRLHKLKGRYVIAGHLQDDVRGTNDPTAQIFDGNGKRLNNAELIQPEEEYILIGSTGIKTSKSSFVVDRDFAIQAEPEEQPNITPSPKSKKPKWHVQKRLPLKS